MDSLTFTDNSSFDSLSLNLVVRVVDLLPDISAYNSSFVIFLSHLPAKSILLKYLTLNSSMAFVTSPGIVTEVGYPISSPLLVLVVVMVVVEGLGVGVVVLICVLGSLHHSNDHDIMSGFLYLLFLTTASQPYYSISPDTRIGRHNCGGNQQVFQVFQ